MKKHRASCDARQQGLNEWHWSLKAGPCVDCGRKFKPWQMDFDHLPGSVKEKSIAEMVRSGRSKTRILIEIEKCELVCACCHRDRTHQRRVAQK